ncbi:peptidoglycan/LPS O-acetylase OafA/YrhL [Erwinia toletana]|uniref:Peptidoglycan/LPS O-acetylase OafA/YrhL n=1 Tax=Winslowiella toletana TaxID=92490 RepID=A0ABS4P5R9_9GAMM|nr:acyltransferase [Winslowiella toletana]MBP2167441.1 peptidoglycan/LPS O-acetylase OafA/YrhL [Winslowiella toletana]
MSTSRGWSTELEGLRGFASLWVLLGHVSLLVHCTIPIISMPSMGVDLFILLSGYLMAKNYIERQQKEPWNSVSTVKKFWIRRFFRIAPLYYLLLIVAMVNGHWYGEMRDTIAQFFPSTATETSRYADQSLGNIVSHLSFTFGFLPGYSFNTVLPDWSIGLEMQFYLLFPFIMLLTLRLGYIPTLLVLMAVCAAGRFALASYYEAFAMPSMILIKLHMFMAGMLLAEAVRKKHPGYLLAALIAPVLSAVISSDLSKLAIVMEAVMIIGMAAILWQYRPGAMMQKAIALPRAILTNRFSTWLGDVSYSVYLLHLLIVVPAIALLLRDYHMDGVSAPLRFGIVCAICIPLTYAIATLLYRFVEKPGILLGKRVLAPRPAASDIAS